MSESVPHTDETSSRTDGGAATVRPTRARKSLVIAGCVIALLLATCLYSPGAVEQLLLGWLYLPLRVAPLFTVDWPTFIVGVTCAAVFLVVLHITLRWLSGRSAVQAGLAIRRIGIRTTFALALTVLLLFVSGTAMVGAAHQLIWLITGRKNQVTEDRHAVPTAGGLVAQARAAARRSLQRNNLKQIGLDVHTFHDFYSTLPPGGTIDDHGRLMHGWAIYLGACGSYSNIGIDFSVPWNESPNDRLYRCALPMFLNPSIPEVFDSAGFGVSHFAGNVHVLPITRVPATSPSASGLDAVLAARNRDDADLRNLPLRIDDIHDGTTNTILIGEAAGHFRPWGHPANVRDPALGVGQNADGFGGPPGAEGAQFLFLDGSVRFISDHVDRKIIRALGTPAGAEKTDAEFIAAQ